MEYLLLFHGKSGSLKAPQYYVIVDWLCRSIVSGEGNVLADEEREVREKREVEVLDMSDGEITVTDFVGRHDGFDES